MMVTLCEILLDQIHESHGQTVSDRGIDSADPEQLPRLGCLRIKLKEIPGITRIRTVTVPVIALYPPKRAVQQLCARLMSRRVSVER